MFLVMMWGIALDKELFVKTISGSGVSVFGALLYSAMLSLWSLWEMRDKPRRYSRLG